MTSTAIADAVQRLQRHPGIVSVGTTVSLKTGTAISIEVAVSLPSRSRRVGVSTTGVRATEPCALLFGSDWPLSAPRPYLREDFPLELPHINPHRPGTLVSPCIFEGSLDELLHRFGLDAIVDQLVDWLCKAAAGTLIDLEQGWEPTRRDACDAKVVFSAEQLLAALPRDGALLRVQAPYLTEADEVTAMLDRTLTPAADMRFSQNLRDGGNWAIGDAAAFVVQAPEHGDQPQVFDRYEPETVGDLPALLARATALGIDAAALQQALDDYYRDAILRAADDPRAWKHGVVAIVVLAAHRPAPLVGAPGRNVEFLTYVIRFKVDSANPAVQTTSVVYPAFHVHALSPALLARTSNIRPEATTQPLVMIGCGSLGSKIALHLARAGFGNLTLVDNDSLSPHNIARHALLQEFSVLVPPRKAELLKEALRTLSHAGIQAHHDDATRILTDADRFAQVIPNGALVIDTTASLKVLAAETMSAPLDACQARLLRIAMYGQGRGVVTLLESLGRASRVDDLLAFLFERCRRDPGLRDTLRGEGAEPTRLFVGENCRSLTMPMSDATISRSAALATIQLESWLQGGLPDGGLITVGEADDSGVGMTWSHHDLAPTTVLQLPDDGGWQVRVLAPVADAIDEQARQWGAVETGGALLGHLAVESRTITIAGAIDAPPDSTRAPTRFVLGTQGLIASLRTAHQSSLGYLQFVGTWHSHPQGGRHSGIDRETLRKIADDAGGMPAVSLVWTPGGLTCAVDRW